MVIFREKKAGGLRMDEVRDVASEFFSKKDYSGKRVLVIIPDNTRSGPIGEVFKVMFEFLTPKVNALDCLAEEAPVQYGTRSFTMDDPRQNDTPHERCVL